MAQAQSNAQTSPPPNRSPLKRNRGGTQPLHLTRDGIVKAALPVLGRVGIDGPTVQSTADDLR